MKRMPRRRSRLRSGQYATARWKPSLALVVLVAGVLVGFAFGIRGRLADQSASLQEHYMLLVSDLFAQGEPLASTQDRLVNLGFSDPSVAVVGVANQLNASPDKVKQQEADQLRQFAAALAAGSASEAPGAAVGPLSAATAAPSPSPDTHTQVAVVVAVPSATDAAAAALAPTATLATATPVPAQGPANPAPVVTVSAPAAPATNGKTAVVRSSDRQPVFLRRDPTVKSAAVSVMPYGSTVVITGVVQGEAIDPGDARWDHVTFHGHPGYVYAKYVQTGG